MNAGIGAQAARSEKKTISPASGSRDLRTMGDYVPAAARRHSAWLTNKLIAERAGAERPLNYAIGWAGGELAKW
jgi:hypothetical protein